MNTRRMLIGIVSGILTGVVIGVLYAPHKGIITRRRIRRQGDEIADAAKEKISDYTEFITDKFDRVKREISDYSDVFRKKFHDLKRAKTAMMN